MSIGGIRHRTLKNNAAFRAVAAASCKWITPGFIVQMQPRPDDAPAAACAFGFTATRKLGGAVERNRAKRRLRACVQRVLPRHLEQSASPLAFVFIARSPALTLPMTVLEKDMAWALRKLAAQ